MRRPYITDLSFHLTLMGSNIYNSFIKALDLLKNGSKFMHSEASTQLGKVTEGTGSVERLICLHQDSNPRPAGWEGAALIDRAE